MPLMRSWRRARSSSIRFMIGFLGIETLNQVAILDQFMDQRIDLAQRLRRLWAALEIAAYEAIFAHPQLQRSGAGLIDSRTTVFLGQREYAQDAAHSSLGLTMMDGIAQSSDAGPGLVSAGQQAVSIEWCAPRTIFIADAVAAAFLSQVFAQQHAGARIEQAHEHGVPLHIDLSADPARGRTIVGSIDFNAAIEMDGSLSVLVITERLERKHLEGWLLFREHGRHLPLGPTVDARVGPVLFPVVQISLCLFQALETLALQRRLLRVAHTGFHFSFSIRVPHFAGQRGYTVVSQNIAKERVQTGIIDIGRPHGFAQIIEDDQPCGAAQATERLFMQLRPDPCTGTEHQQPHRFATVAQGEHEQPRAPVLARVRIADHRTRPIVHLALFTWLGLDDSTGFGRSGTAPFPHITLHALIATREPVVIDQVLPDAHGVAATSEFQFDQFPIGLATAQRWLPIRGRTRLLQ